MHCQKGARRRWRKITGTNEERKKGGGVNRLMVMGGNALTPFEGGTEHTKSNWAEMARTGG